jgi:hypothetical protein
MHTRKDETMSKDLVPANNPGGLAELADEVLAPGERLGIADLPRVRMPAAGGTTWELPTGEPAKEIEGVIVHRQLTRAYWAADFDGGASAPDCSSSDAVTGIGTPGGSCATCPNAQFGSASDGRGQACRLITQLYVSVDGAPLPWVLSLPPSAATATRQYVVSLLAVHGLPYWAVRTAIRLERRQSPQGIMYSVPVFATVRHLDESERATVERMRPIFAAIASSAPVLADVE